MQVFSNVGRQFFVAWHLKSCSATSAKRFSSQYAAGRGGFCFSRRILLVIFAWE
jgi:hypothetical protein